MNEQKAAGMIGLAVKAGQAAAGTDATRIMARTGKCGAVLVDGETSENTRKKAEDLCRRTEIPIIVLPAGLIWKATGKDNMVIGIRKGSFSEQILKITGEQ